MSFFNSPPRFPVPVLVAGNSASITQTGTADNYTSVQQGLNGSAFDNKAVINQTGEKIDVTKRYNAAGVFQGYVGSAQGNDATITQNGQDNSATVIDAFYGNAYRNHSTIDQVGNDNYGIFYHAFRGGVASDNTDFLAQKGQNNKTAVTQFNTAGKVSVTQDGENNKSDITQQTTSNQDSITLAQKGYGNNAAINQMESATYDMIQNHKIVPTNNRVTADQTSNLFGINMLTVTQGASNTFVNYLETDNVATILQATLNGTNLAGVVQNGVDDKASVVQSGSGNNSAFITQADNSRATSLHNTASINQSGAMQSGSAFIHQGYLGGSASGAKATINQSGTGQDTATIDQGAGSFGVFFTPTSTNDTAMVKQGASNATARIFQGSGNAHSDSNEVNITQIGKDADTLSSAVVQQGSNGYASRGKVDILQNATVSGSNYAGVYQGIYGSTVEDKATITQVAASDHNTATINQGTNEGQSRNSIASIAQNASSGDNNATINQGEADGYFFSTQGASYYDIASITQNGGGNTAEIDQGMVSNPLGSTTHGLGSSAYDQAIVLQNGNSNIAQINQGKSSLSDHAFATILQNGQGNSAIVSQATAVVAATR